MFVHAGTETAHLEAIHNCDEKRTPYKVIGEYAEKVYIYHLVNAATALANASRQNVGGSHTAVQDISVGFGVDRQRLNVVCTEAPGVVVYTDPAMDDEGDMDSVLDGNYGATSLGHNQRPERSLPSAQRSYAPTSSPAVYTEYSQQPEPDTSPSFWENVVQGRYPEV